VTVCESAAEKAAVGAVRPSAVRGLGVGLLVTALAGCGAPAGSSAQSPAAATSRRTSSPSNTDVPAFHSVRTYQEVALPVRLRIPAQYIDTTLIRLGLAADGTIAAPSRWEVAGWYDEGPRPGQRGPAVIVGHVDSRSGPAVFFRLTKLRPGDAAYVDREDGTTVRFRVTGRRQFAKNRFPADLVYSPTLKTSLLLITCGGSFDHASGHYRDNVIVTAVPG
jgi:sortase (surface protein transpeptidase)